MEKLIRYLIKHLYHNKIISRIFHTLVYCLKRELQDCQSVLDLGCGPDSPVKYCDASSSVGVDAFRPYIEKSEKNKIHDEYILKDITKVTFKPKSFDAVIMIEVLEHLKKDAGRKLLREVEKWARKKVVVSTPSGYVSAEGTDGNPFQTHRSGWTVEEMENLGYRAYGMAGWKFLRGDEISGKVDQKEELFPTIRFRPKNFWLLVSELTQLIVYYFPKLAFEVFYVKKL